MIMPNDVVSRKNIEETAWEHTLAVHDWIWKCIQKRNIPDEDTEDVFMMCQLEVYQLMLKYNPMYSVTTWASYGILKGLTLYESTCRIVRLPIHIVEKMNRLNKQKYLLSKQGYEMTPEEMSEYVGMNILDIMTASEKANSSCPSDIQEFLNHKNDTVENSLINGHDKNIVDQMVENDTKDEMYRKLHILDDVEIFVLLHRFCLDWNEIPWRKHFFNERSDLCISRYIEQPKTYSLAQIGRKVGVSRERIRQIESEAIGKLQGGKNEKEESEERSDDETT